MFRAKLRTLVCKPPVNCSVTHKPLDNKNNGTCYDCYQFVIKRLIEIAETRINTGFFKQLDLFGINEPILFGAPVVMNPMLAIPFIGMPVIACLIQYFALYTGICPLYGATQIPWTCPPIISGFLLAGWKSALLQLVILCVSFFVYLPFIKKVDKMNLVQEKNQPVEDEDEDW